MSKQVPKPRHRPGLIALAILGAIICLLLAYWQFSRWDSASGSGLNFGYALQWPFFGAFLIFIYVRFIRLEAEHDNQQPGESAEAAGGALPVPEDTAATEEPVTEIPEDILPTRRPTVQDVDAEDDTLAAYNRYLEELNEAGGAARTAGER